MAKRVSIHNVSDYQTRLGSLWQSMENRDDVVRLLALGMETTSSDDLIGIMAGLVGDWDQSRVVTRRSMKFSAEDVSPFAVNDTAEFEGNWGVGPEVRYALRFSDYLPLRILGPERLLLLGCDFFQGQNGWVEFVEDPNNLWPGREIIVDTATLYQPNQHLVTQLSSVPAIPNLKDLVSYIRNSPTAGMFRRVLAGLAGQVILPRPLDLVTIEASGTGWRYIDRDGWAVTVQHEHTKLTVGEVYEEGYIFGTQTRVLDRTYGHRWWNLARWSGGIDAGPIGLPGQSLLSDSVVYGTASGFGRIELGAGADSLWDGWEAANQPLGPWLTQMYSLPSVAPDDDHRASTGAKKMSALDALFEAGYKERALIVEVEVDQLPQIQAILGFLREHQPADRPVIVLGILKDLPGETWVSGDTLNTQEVIRVSSAAVTSVPEAFDLRQMMTEKITIS